jgi:lipopolysaccharide transport system ATP-binding protein
MYLRLAFSVAINMEPDILLADEVLAVGDLEFQEKCLDRVKDAGRHGTTVLFVSHDMAAITRLCDKVLWLNGGEIVRFGDPADVVSAYQNSAWSLSSTRLKNKRGPHMSQIGEILSVTLLSAGGRQIGALRAMDESRIRIVHRLTEPGYTIRYTMHVKARGAVAFRSRSPEDIPREEPGIYVAEVTVPAGLLADTIYTVDVDVVGIRDKEWVPMTAHNALSFQVFDPESQQRDHIGGVVSPRLKWDFAGQPIPDSPPVETGAAQ